MTTSKQFPIQIPKKTEKFGRLYQAGKALTDKMPFALLVFKKKQLEKRGFTNLTISY